MSLLYVRLCGLIYIRETLNLKYSRLAAVEFPCDINKALYGRKLRLRVPHNKDC